MQRDYHSWSSPVLGRRMEMLVFGHGGTPSLVFPTSMGAFFEYEDRGMVGAVADKLEAGAFGCFACRRWTARPFTRTASRANASTAISRGSTVC